MTDNSESLVLVVDDRDATRYVTVRVLRAAGFATLEASTGAEALALAAAHKPDVVLLDINLPDISGFEVCARPRADEATAAVAIVQISATFEAPEYQVRGLEGGADTFLVAPVEPTVLVATVRAMLRLRRAEARLREFDRRKDEFLATLAHELRNPLAPLFYCLDLLEDPALPEPDMQQTLAVMRRQSEHLHRLVDDLVDMSRITQNKLTLRVAPVTLQEIVAAAVEARRPELEARGQRLELDLPKAPVELEADLVRLAQVFGNLLSNASRYSDEGSRISIRAEVETEHVVVTVSDEGVGISAEDLERVFEPFVQLRKPGGAGLGIGLALVYRLVQMHGGTIHAASEGPGRGSTFTLRLPRRPVPAASPSDGEPEDRAVPRRRVLVVDDNVDAAESMVRLLAAMGQDVKAVYGGREAVETAEALPPEVVFMDISMPGMDGLECIRRMRGEAWGEATVICTLSGHGLPDDVESSLAAGADLHLVKPIGRAELTRALTARRATAVPRTEA